MISKEKKFIFVHIPKTAGTAIQNVLLPYSDDAVTLGQFDGENHHYIEINNDFSTLPYIFPHKDSKIYKHSRLIDYRKVLDIDEFYTFTCVRNPWDRILSWYLSSLKDGEISSERRFRRFIRFRANGVPPNLPQYKFIHPGVDYVIRFEKLQEGFNAVCNAIGIPARQLPVVNKSKGPNVGYRHYYGERTRKLVGELFAEDIELFNYTF